MPQPKKPVRWPIVAANKPIAGGKLPEANGTLKVYTWVDHVSQRCLDDFSQRYRCAVELTTFSTITQALATLRRGRGVFDVFLGAPTDIIGPLVDWGIIQPLRHSYIPNARHTWPVFADP
jgi:spermidine/putrescine transport system substrate-binding protein